MRRIVFAGTLNHEAFWVHPNLWRPPTCSKAGGNLSLDNLEDDFPLRPRVGKRKDPAEGVLVDCVREGSAASGFVGVDPPVCKLIDLGDGNFRTDPEVSSTPREEERLPRKEQEAAPQTPTHPRVLSLALVARMRYAGR